LAQATAEVVAECDPTHTHNGPKSATAVIKPARAIFELKFHHPARILLSSTVQLGCAKIALAQQFSFVFFKNE
jgi:hypothetical protein